MIGLWSLWMKLRIYTLVSISIFIHTYIGSNACVPFDLFKFVRSSLFVLGLIDSIGGYFANLQGNICTVIVVLQWSSMESSQAFLIWYDYFQTHNVLFLKNQEMIFWIPPGKASIIAINRPIKKTGFAKLYLHVSSPFPTYQQRSEHTHLNLSKRFMIKKKILGEEKYSIIYRHV